MGAFCRVYKAESLVCVYWCSSSREGEKCDSFILLFFLKLFTVHQGNYKDWCFRNNIVDSFFLFSFQWTSSFRPAASSTRLARSSFNILPSRIRLPFELDGIVRNCARCVQCAGTGVAIEFPKLLISMMMIPSLFIQQQQRQHEWYFCSSPFNWAVPLRQYKVGPVFFSFLSHFSLFPLHVWYPGLEQHARKKNLYIFPSFYFSFPFHYRSI